MAQTNVEYARLKGNTVVSENRSVVNVPDGTTYTLRTEDSGKIHVMPDLTADCTITMPAEADGLNYVFIYGGAAADAQDWIFDTGANANYFVGGLAHLDTDAGSGGDEVVPVYSDGNSNSKMTVLVPDCGTRVEMICDGTVWYVNGTVVGATAPTFADQS